MKKEGIKTRTDGRADERTIVAKPVIWNTYIFYMMAIISSFDFSIMMNDDD